MINTEEEIRLLLTKMESDCIERTTSIREDKMGPAVCALSNDFPNHRQPGYILIGVEDDGRIAGMKFTDEHLQQIGSVKTNGNVLPQPSIVVSRIFTFPEGDVIVVEVKPSTYPPVRYDGRCWIRIGPRRARTTQEEEKMLVERQAAYLSSFNVYPVIGATLEELNTEYFKTNYLPAAVDAETLAENNRTLEDQLASFRFFNKTSKCPTYAGIIVFGYRPIYYIGGDYVQYVKFDGEEMTAHVQAEKIFKGPLITELKYIEDFIKINIVKERPVPRQGTFREDIVRNYPFWAVRELVMNAIMHRNYESNAPVYIYEFTNRIEIVNPGGLYGIVNANNFPYACDYRNIVLAEAMKVLGYVNRFNYGIQRAKELLKLNNNPEPVFDISLITKFKVTVGINGEW